VSGVGNHFMAGRQSLNKEQAWQEHNVAAGEYCIKCSLFVFIRLIGDSTTGLSAAS